MRALPRDWGCAWAQPVPLYCSWALYRVTVPGYTGIGAGREPTCVEDKGMHLQRQWWSGLVAAMLGGLVGVTTVVAAGEQFLPVLSTREGAFRSLQIPLADGYIAYLTLLNERDGGINGVKLDVRFISSLPVKRQSFCTAWADKRLAHIVGDES
jgi:hypothetical protein